MSNTWDEMRDAKENQYFEQKNAEAVERLKKKQEEEKPRLSPITGEPMVQEVLHGVVIDRCPTSKGIWLDAGELEQLIEATGAEEALNSKSILKDFFTSLSGGK